MVILGNPIAIFDGSHLKKVGVGGERHDYVLPCQSLLCPPLLPTTETWQREQLHAVTLCVPCCGYCHLSTSLYWKLISPC